MEMKSLERHGESVSLNFLFNFKTFLTKELVSKSSDFRLKIAFVGRLQIGKAKLIG
jgi:hypothetical protein